MIELRHRELFGFIRIGRHKVTLPMPRNHQRIALGARVRTRIVELTFSATGCFDLLVHQLFEIDPVFRQIVLKGL